MKKIFFILLIFLTVKSFGQVPTGFTRFYSKNAFTGTWNVETGNIVMKDTSTAPVGIGETRFQLSDSTVYIGLSTTGKKWYKLRGDLPAGVGTGTVTSVGASIDGSVISVSGSPITNIGTLAFTWNGNATDVVLGNGAYTPYTTLITGVTNPLYSPIGHSHVPGDITGLTTYVGNLFHAGTGLIYDPDTRTFSYPGDSSGITSLNGLTDGVQYLDIDTTAEGASWSSVGTTHTLKLPARIFSGSGGSGNTNSNIGSGFRLAVPGTNNIKTLFNGYAVNIDSTSNTDALTLKADSSLLLTKLMAAATYQPIGSYVTGYKRFGFSGEDDAAAESRSIGFSNTYNMTFGSVSNFIVSRAGINRILMNNISSSIFSPDGNQSVQASDVLAQLNAGSGANTFGTYTDSSSAIKRISYATNLHSTFTDYSLVDKSYVDSADGTASNIYNSDGQVTDALRQVYAQGVAIKFRDSSFNYVNLDFNATGALQFDSYTTDNGFHKDAEVLWKPGRFWTSVNNYDNNRGIELEILDSVARFKPYNGGSQILDVALDKLRVDSLGGFGGNPRMAGVDNQGNFVRLDSLNIDNLHPFIIDGTTLGTHWGDFSFGYDGGGAMKYTGINPYTSHKNELSLSPFSSFNKISFNAADSAYIKTEANVDSAFAQYSIKAYLQGGTSKEFIVDPSFYQFKNLSSSSDTTTYKPGAYDADGKLVRMNYWPGSGSGGGSGTVTDFVFTDGNGFDGTVSTSTSTPTLSLTTTVGNTQIMYSNSGAITGSLNLVYDDTEKQITTGQGKFTGGATSGPGGYGSNLLLNSSAPAALFKSTLDNTAFQIGYSFNSDGGAAKFFSVDASNNQSELGEMALNTGNTFWKQGTYGFYGRLYSSASTLFGMNIKPSSGTTINGIARENTAISGSFMAVAIDNILWGANAAPASASDADTYGQMKLNSGGELLIGSLTDNGAYKLQVTGNALIGLVTLPEQAAPSTPATGYGALYPKTDGKLYWKDDAGTEYDLTGGGGGLADGDYGDITVGGTGTTMTIDNSAVTDAKINDVAVSKITGLYSENAITSNATWSPVGSSRENNYDITAQAAAVTTVSAPSGTPANHNTLLLRVTSDASARAIGGWDAIYRAGTNLALPTTTTASKTMYIKFIYNSTASKWDLVSVIDGL